MPRELTPDEVRDLRATLVTDLRAHAAATPYDDTADLARRAADALEDEGDLRTEIEGLLDDLAEAPMMFKPLAAADTWEAGVEDTIERLRDLLKRHPVTTW